MNDEEFWAALEPKEPNPIFFRLYYRDDGTPICYSMEVLPHNYIEIDAETFHRGPLNARVVDGELKIIKPASLVKKLIPGDHGVACDPRDVCIVVEETQPHTKWSIVTNETD